MFGRMCEFFVKMPPTCLKMFPQVKMRKRSSYGPKPYSRQSCCKKLVAFFCTILVLVMFLSPTLISSFSLAHPFGASLREHVVRLHFCLLPPFVSVSSPADQTVAAISSRQPRNRIPLPQTKSNLRN